MAAKQFPGDGMTLNVAGMSKNQLYDIMSQMKTLIEQNQQQAREILIQNPILTKALFQAQIMLGMVQPPQIPKVQPPVQPLQQPSAQPMSFPGQASFQDQASASQTQFSLRKQPQNQSRLPISSAHVPAVSLQPQPVASHPLQLPQPPKLHQNLPATPMTLPQSSQPPAIPPIPLHSTSKPPPLQQPQIPPVSSQLQQPIQTTGIPQASLQPALQPPMPSQPRPPTMQSYHHQYPPQMGPNVGFPHSGGPQHASQPMYHSAAKPPSSMGSFAQGQPSLPSQQPPQSLYQGGASHSGTEFTHQAGGPVQGDGGSSWIPGLSEPTKLPGPPALAPSQASPANQPARTPALSPEMEKALLQQVMSLTQEQINLLPPDQRNQVLQLQQMLRQ